MEDSFEFIRKLERRKEEISTEQVVEAENAIWFNPLRLRAEYTAYRSICDKQVCERT